MPLVRWFSIKVTMPISGPDVGPPPYGSFVENAFKSIHSHKDKIFLIDDCHKTETTYEDFTKRCTSIAVKLKKMGIGKDVVVGCLAGNSIESFSFQFAVYFASGIWNPMNHFMKRDEVRKMISVGKPAVIFCDNEYLSMAESAAVDVGWKIAIVARNPDPGYLSYGDFLNEDTTGFNVKIDDPATHVNLVPFTSGSTGMPKAVKVRDEIPMIFERKKQEAFYFDKFVLTSPMFWMSNYMFTTFCILRGKTLIFPETCDPEGVIKCVTKFKADSFFSAVSVLLDMCTLPNLHEFDMSSVEKVMTGGSRASIEQKQTIRKKLLNNRNILMNLYGSSEAGAVTVYKRAEICSPEDESIGVVAPGVTLKIVDLQTGRELGPKQEGEFCIKSKTLMAGYMNPDIPFGKDADGWFHLGDIGYYDENGFVYYTRRLKDVMKYRNIQIAPAELEQVLLKHPDVLEACVISTPHPVDGDWPTAFVIKKPNSSLAESFLDEMVTENVGDVKRLRGGIYFLKEFPRNPVGKILKLELPKYIPNK